MKKVPLSTLFRTPRNGLFTAALVLALLWAQWLGFEHGILHGAGHVGASHGLSRSLLAQSGIDAIFEDPQDDGQTSFSPHHSCAAFEAATLASGATSTIHFDASCALTGAQPARIIPEFYLPLFAALFNSRAPPHFLPSV
jgi:hypothetical protein